MSTDHHRIFGLDLMRAVAIVLVVFFHSDDLWAEWFPHYPGLSRVDGVDIFFVLSGYLIGGVMLRYVAMDQVPWQRRLVDFWQRRWLRTLPNYYLFLLINIVLVQSGLVYAVLNYNVLAFFVFLQNLYVPVNLFFFESWSLSVEEWFYLLFPILLIFFNGIGLSGSKGLVFTIVLIIGAPTLLRFQVAPNMDTLHTADLYIRKLVIYRLDSIGFGVCAAFLHFAVPKTWAHLRWHLFMIGSVTLCVAAYFHGEAHLWFSMTWYFTLAALSMAMLLPLLSAWVVLPSWGVPVVFLSRVSYALYLVHVPVRDLLLPLMKGLSMSVTIGLYVLYWFVCIGLSWLVLRFWEQPFMDMRDRLGSRLLRSTPSS